MDEFVRDWTYRTPLTTIFYRKGDKVKLDPITQIRARKAGVLAYPSRKGKSYGRGLAKAGAPRHSSEA